MATPTPVSYSVPHGATCYGGRSAPPVALPSFVPAPGQLKSIHLNDLASLNPCPGGQCWYSEANKLDGPWTLWTGGVFASEYSTYGAMVYWGGGHNGYDGTEHYIFDLTTQQWSRLGSPIATDFLPSLDPTWCDYQGPNGPVVPAVHNYTHPVYIPPSMGGGVKGSWMMPFNAYGPDSNAVNGQYNPHAVDLATGAWTRFTTSAYSAGVTSPQGGAFVDVNRKVVWGLAETNSPRNIKIDLTQASRTIVPVSSFYSPGWYSVPAEVPSKDMVIFLFGTYQTESAPQPSQLCGYDLSSGTPVQFTITQSNPFTMNNGAGWGFAWCPDTGKFYAYEGRGTKVLQVLTPPAGDWKKGTWTWSTETMTGEAPVNTNDVKASTGWQPFTKWKYNPKLKCFMWSQGTDSRQSPDGVTRTGAFQLYRPLGT